MSKVDFKHGSACSGASRSSRDSLPSALRAPSQPARPRHDLGRGVSFTLSPSPPRVTGEARHTPLTVVAHEASLEELPTALGERLDLALEEMSSDTDDDVSIANLLFFHIYICTCFFLSVLLTNSSIFMQFSIGINPRNLPAISVDVYSLHGSDVQLTPADPATATQEPVVQSQGA